MSHFQKLDRSSVGMRNAAAITMVNNETHFLPIWINHYLKYFEPQDLYVINHNPDEEFSKYLKTIKDLGVNICNAHNDRLWNELWRRDLVNSLQHFLISSYKAVIYNDVDELLEINPDSKYKDLNDYISSFVQSGKECVRAQGYNIVSNPGIDKPIDLSIPIMQQRERWKLDNGYSKPYLTSVPVNYLVGFHTTESEYHKNSDLFKPAEYLIDQDLLAIHIHYIDILWIIEKNQKRTFDKWDKDTIKWGLSYQNLPKNFEQEKKQFLTFYYDSQKIPEKFKNLI
jgi:hypothetical protein